MKVMNQYKPRIDALIEKLPPTYQFKIKEDQYYDMKTYPATPMDWIKEIE